MAFPETLPHLPILVGVTGHRDILPTAEPEIRRSTHAAMAALRHCLGPSLVLMTALAEGADQLAAEVARDLAIPMIAISPMPIERYRRTMSTPDALAALDRLWLDPAVLQRIELPLLPDTPADEQDAAQYEQLGLLLSRQSHILLALWNGYDPEPRSDRAGPMRAVRGGSPHVVAMRQNGEWDEVTAEAIWRSPIFFGLPPRLETARSGPILQVVTPRVKGNGACGDYNGVARAPGALLWWSDLPAVNRHHRWNAFKAGLWPGLASEEHAGEPHWQVVSSTDLAAKMPDAYRHLRRAGVRLAKRDAAMGDKAESSFLCKDADLAGPRDGAALRGLRRLFDIADADASRVQRWLLGTWLPGMKLPETGWPRPGLLLGFALGVPLAALCFEIVVDYNLKSQWFGLYLAAIIVPSFIYLMIVRLFDLQGRYQDHRALAEGLRVQFFWAASGVAVAVSDNYLRHQTGTLGWIRLALRGPALSGLAAALACPGGDSAFVQQHWIDDQMAYFKRQGDLQEGASVRLKRLARAAVVALLVIASMVTAGAFLGWNEIVARSFPDWTHELPFLALGMLPAVVAFFVIILEVRAFEEHAHAYSQIFDVFKEARRQAAALEPQHTREWRDLLLALGKEALTENANWIHTHRGRPVANRVGG